MRNRRRIWIVSVLGALALCLGFHLWPEGEPYYDGRPLSYWAKLYGRDLIITTEERKALASRLDTNTFPYLLKWVENQRDKTRLSMTLHKILGELNKAQRNALGGQDRDSEILARGASRILMALGPKAAPCVSELERLLINSTNVFTRNRVTMVLGTLGDLGLPVLAAALTNANPAVRHSAVRGLHDQGTNARPLVPQLLEILADSDPEMVWYACVILRRLEVDTGLIVPKLIPLLSHSNDQYRVVAASCLRILARHKEARSAVPTLQAALNDDSLEVRKEAARALRFIAPEMFTNGVPEK